MLGVKKNTYTIGKSYLCRLRVNALFKRGFNLLLDPFLQCKGELCISQLDHRSRATSFLLLTSSV